MAVLQCTDELEVYMGNKYSLVIVAAKRARQIKDGHPQLAQDESPNPISIALREIQERKVGSLAPPVEEIAPAPRDVITSLASGLEFDMDEDMDLDEGDAVDELAALLVGGDEEEEEREPRAPVIGAVVEDETEGLNADVEEGDDEDEDEDDGTSTTSSDSDDD